MSAKEEYKGYCQQEKDIPLFLTYNWLNALLNPQEWDVALLVKGGELAGVLPYYYAGNNARKMIKMPVLTPYMGVWIKYPPGQKEATRLSYEKEIIDDLLEKAGPFRSFYQKLTPAHTNGLPFHWNGFKQATRYTYLLNDLSDIDRVHKGFQQNIRSQIRKGEEQLKVIESAEIQDLYRLKVKSYKEKGNAMPFELAYVERLYEGCQNEDSGLLLSAEDKDNNKHAMILLVWDNKYCYYLLGASDPQYKNSGAMSLLMWKAIQLAAEKSLVFNFEGSMIQSVERFFRSFGAIQTPYLEIEKVNSLTYKVFQGVRRLLRH